MRFLKKKVQLKPDFLDKNNNDILKYKADDQSTTSEIIESESENSSGGIQEVILAMRKPRQKPTCPNGNSKNIVKNYGRALCAFATSSIAAPYIHNIMTENDFFVDIQIFGDYIKTKKEKINSIESLKELLIASEKDEQNTCFYKQIFQKVSIIFLKYFSVNWIFSGRLMHKRAHLDFRFKMLRRIQNPEYFTYLRTPFRS